MVTVLVTTFAGVLPISKVIPVWVLAESTPVAFSAAHSIVLWVSYTIIESSLTKLFALRASRSGSRVIEPSEYKICVLLAPIIVPQCVLLP